MSCGTCYCTILYLRQLFKQSNSPIVARVKTRMSICTFTLHNIIHKNNSFPYLRAVVQQLRAPHPPGDECGGAGPEGLAADVVDAVGGERGVARGGDVHVEREHCRLVEKNKNGIVFRAYRREQQLGKSWTSRTYPEENHVFLRNKFFLRHPGCSAFGVHCPTWLLGGGDP